MTLIASFCRDNILFGFSDVLMTGERDLSKLGINFETDLPSRRNINQYRTESSNNFVAYLRQKTYFPTSTISLQWAGREDQAINYINKFENLLSKTNSIIDCNDETIKNIPPEYRNDLSIINKQINLDNNEINFCSYNANNIDVDGCDNFLISGTGSTYKNYLNHFKGVVIQKNFDNSYLDNTMHLLAMSANLLGIEFISLHNLNNLFGGGYEMSVLRNNKFIKLNNIMYLIWLFNYDKEKYSLAWYPILIKQEYFSDLLIFRRLTLETIQEFKEYRVIDDYNCPVYPINKIPEDYNSLFSQPSLDYNLLVSCIIMHDGAVKYPACSVSNNSSDLTLERNGLNIQTEFSQEFKSVMEDSLVGNTMKQ